MKYPGVNASSRPVRGCELWTDMWRFLKEERSLNTTSAALN